MIIFAERFKQLRKQKGLNQEELANIFYSHKSSISRYESGKQIPEIETLKQYADFFNVSVDYLLGRTQNKEEVLPQPCDEYERVVVKARDEEIPPSVIEDFIDFWKKNNSSK